MRVESQIFFDLRQSNPIFNWNHLGEGRYLRDFALKKDIERPLSIDASIWPRVRLEEVGDDAESVECWKLSVGPPPNHWESLTEFMSAVARLPKPTQETATVLIFEEVEQNSPLSLLPDSATILGFDVADREMWVSGLMSCGYLEEDWARFDLERFVPHLNRWHLFDEMEPAIEFAKMSDSRVEEHSPFAVYRLATVPFAH